MTKREIEKILEFWKPRLFLTHWDVSIVWDEFDEDKNGHAYVWRSRDYDEARLYFSPKWQEWTPHEANLHVVHELVHLVTRDFEFVLNMIEDQMHRDVEKVVEESHRHHMEQAVDRLARIVVGLAPKGMIQ